MPRRYPTRTDGEFENPLASLAEFAAAMATLALDLDVDGTAPMPFPPLCENGAISVYEGIWEPPPLPFETTGGINVTAYITVPSRTVKTCPW